MQTTESKYIFACQKQNKDMKLLLSVRTYILVLFILDYFVPFFVNLMQVYQEKRLRGKERYRVEMLKYKSNGSAPQWTLIWNPQTFCSLILFHLFYTENFPMKN
jgi:hypothetical protein